MKVNQNINQITRRKFNNRQIRFNLKRLDSITGWLFISPMFIGLCLFMFGPILFAFYMSLTEWELVGDSTFIGIGNYKTIMNDSEFLTVLKNTIIFTGGLVPLNISLALILALLLNNHIPGIGFFRTAIFVPVVTSLVVWAIVWKYMFATDFGFVNQILGLIGIEQQAWLYNKKLAMSVVIFTSVIKNVGLNMILFLAGLQMVPKGLYEAARIDGANRFRQFTNITLPVITPTIFLTTIITIIGAMKIFSQIFVMTRGGPENGTKVLVYYIWEKAFRTFDLGYASALAFILFFIILIFTLIQWQLRKRWVFNED